MSEVLLQTLRELRSQAEELNKSIRKDLNPFRHPFDNVTFLRTPSSERKKNDVNVTTTCSCLMALALTNTFEKIYPKGGQDAARAFGLVVDAPWQSSSLIQNNPFTTSLVLRTLGFLRESGISKTAVSCKTQKRWSLNSAGKSKMTMTEIAVSTGSSEQNFTINKYPPTAAVIYWFLDGVSRANIRLHARNWRTLCGWAREEFNHQLSLVVSQHEAMMDPVAMAMSACLCARLRTILESPKPGVFRAGAHSEQLRFLPSTIELEHAIEQLFSQQRNGIWPKYFPLFHYQDAGSNFCFTFELLEAILCEFGREQNTILDNRNVIKGLQDAITWCQRNRLTWRDESKNVYSGWNSGGYLETLQKGQPESWATAVVHMFLWELQKVLSERIQKRLLDEYDVPTSVTRNGAALDRFLNIEIREKSKSQTLKGILRNQIISKYKAETSQTLRNHENSAARSALLFGPPGTSKTNVVEAVAQEMGWPLIQIDPSHFLENSLDGIYVQAGKIFTDLMDLSGVVVLFDEMDALVQTRDSDNKLDTAAQFLTTFMLPKLAALHDQGRIVFFMATNFQDRFDDAIKRAGRFDLLLCMGPPSLNAKLEALHTFTGETKDAAENKAAVRLISQYANQSAELKMQLELYTFAEFRTLIKALCATGPLSVRLAAMQGVGLAQFVHSDSRSAALQVRELEPALTKLHLSAKTIRRLKQLDINREQLRRKKIRETRIVQYFIDRKLSRIAL